MPDNQETEFETKEIFIVAITAPTASKKYGELSCTAGIDRDGNWIRLYPVPLRRLESKGPKIYRKYQWIEAKVKKAGPNDKRPESMRCEFEQIKPLGKVDAKDNWAARKDIVLHSKTGVYTDFQKLLNDADRSNIKVSLAVFKPTAIIKCTVEERDEEKIEEDIKKQKEIAASCSRDLFYEDEDFFPAEPMRIDLKYTFSDCNGKKHTMSVIDWEAYSLSRNAYNEGGIELAKKNVYYKYGVEFLEKDLYFILGTRKDDHLKGRGKNPFSIIGVFYPMKDDQQFLDLFEA